MPISGDDRAQKVYDAAAAKPDFAKLSADEKQAFLAQLKKIYGDDTDYLKANATIVPSAFSVPPGVAVQVAYPAGTGATVGPGTVSGTGRLT